MDEKLILVLYLTVGVKMGSIRRILGVHIEGPLDGFMRRTGRRPVEIS